MPTTRTSPEIRAELDVPVEWRDSYARVCAQAKYADFVAQIAELRRGAVALTTHHPVSHFATDPEITITL